MDKWVYIYTYISPLQTMQLQVEKPAEEFPIILGSSGYALLITIR